MNKKILVTGATGGIGNELCKFLKEKNYDLILAARDMEKLSRLKSELASKDSDVSYCVMNFSDVSSFASLKNFVEDGLDGLVVMPPQLEPTPECLPADDVWMKALSESFVGPLALIREMIPYLTKRVKSKVVIVSGISSAQVLSHYATSNVLRTAWLAEAKTLAFYFGARGIRFNTLSLGGVMTDKYVQKFHAEAQSKNLTLDELMVQKVDNVPLKKYASTREVAIAIETLLSDFTDHITGANILCDGGFTRSY